MKSVIAILILFAIFTKTVNSLSIKCSYEILNITRFEDAYVCLATVTSLSDKYEVESIEGEHVENKAYHDVIGIEITKAPITTIPQGLEKFFPNLETLSLRSCNISVLHGNELENYKSLKNLYLSGNKILKISGDLIGQQCL